MCSHTIGCNCDRFHSLKADVCFLKIVATMFGCQLLIVFQQRQHQKLNSHIAYIAFALPAIYFSNFPPSHIVWLEDKSQQTKVFVEQLTNVLLSYPAAETQVIGRMRLRINKWGRVRFLNGR